MQQHNTTDDLAMAVCELWAVSCELEEYGQSRTVGSFARSEWRRKSKTTMRNASPHSVGEWQSECK
jgi:hypothetical protein